MNNVLFDGPISDGNRVREEIRRVLIVQLGPTEFQITRFNVMRTAKGLEEYGSPSGVIFDVVDGVYRWKSNQSVPPSDALHNYGIDTLPNFDADQHVAVRDRETKVFLDAYTRMMANYVPDAEEMYELEAAFGPGVKVVNIVTGQRYRTGR